MINYLSDTVNEDRTGFYRMDRVRHSGAMGRPVLVTMESARLHVPLFLSLASVTLIMTHSLCLYVTPKRILLLL